MPTRSHPICVAASILALGCSDADGSLARSAWTAQTSTTEPSVAWARDDERALDVRASARASGAPAAATSGVSATSPSSDRAADHELTWLGLPRDPSVALPRPLTFSGAHVRLPEGWDSIALGDGMSETSHLGDLAFLRVPRDPMQPSTTAILSAPAILIISEHGAVHEALMDYGAGRTLGVSAGAHAEWGTPRPSTIGDTSVEIVEGKGKMGADDAEFLQVRRKRPHPTAKGHGKTVFVIGGLRLPAKPEVRRQLFASLGSLQIE